VIGDEMIILISSIICMQTVPIADAMTKVQPLELRQQLEAGKYFRPWVARIREGDPWAMTELILECEKLSAYLDCGLGPMAEVARHDIERVRTSDPGRACYYLAELIRITGDPGERNTAYIFLLEESSKHGYPWADLRLYEESKQGGANSRLKLRGIKDREQYKAKVLELQAQYKEKAFRSLLPLAMTGDVTARQRVYALHEPRFDHLLDKTQARALLEDSASRGSIRAQIEAENLKRGDSNPDHPYFPLVEGSPAFRVLEKAADQYDPTSIQALVDFYVGKKEWVKAKKWANKGKEALGGTNRWLETAWNDVNPPREE
jgi:hypothetical protein